MPTFCPPPELNLRRLPSFIQVRDLRRLFSPFPPIRHGARQVPSEFIPSILPPFLSRNPPPLLEDYSLPLIIFYPNSGSCQDKTRSTPNKLPLGHPTPFQTHLIRGLFSHPPANRKNPLFVSSDLFLCKLVGFSPLSFSLMRISFPVKPYFPLVLSFPTHADKYAAIPLSDPIPVTYSSMNVWVP